MELQSRREAELIVKQRWHAAEQRDVATLQIAETDHGILMRFIKELINPHNAGRPGMLFCLNWWLNTRQTLVETSEAAHNTDESYAETRAERQTHPHIRILTMQWTDASQWQVTECAKSDELMCGDLYSCLLLKLQSSLLQRGILGEYQIRWSWPLSTQLRGNKELRTFESH